METQQSQSPISQSVTPQKILPTFGHCPRCGGAVIEGKKGFGCSNYRPQDGACRFVIWKSISGKEITAEIITKLLTDMKTDMLDGFISKSGKPFSASLKLVQEGDEWKTIFDFPNSSSEVIGKCPACGGDVTEGNKGYGCSNWRDKDGGCKFTIWKTIAQKEIPKKAAIQLLENGVTDILMGFISRKGEAFTARLRLEQDETGKYKTVFDFSDSRRA